ncbi:hypothetical protein MKW92_031394, partial [Papaver armeniacum]
VHYLSNAEEMLLSVYEAEILLTVRCYFCVCELVEFNMLIKSYLVMTGYSSACLINALR